MTAELGMRIVNGEIASGQTLPNEAALCAEFSVSRSAIRESLKVLAARGLIEARTRVGTIVQAPDTWNLLDGEVLSWIRHGPMLDRILTSLLEARALIEPEAAALAARRSRSDELARIEAALDRMTATLGTREAHLQADYAFHDAVLRASGNLIFVRFSGLVRRALMESFRRSSRHKAQRHAAIADHQAVLDAIRARDESGARQATNLLLEHVRDKLFGDLS